MSFFKPKFVLLALASVLLPALWTSGCTGGAFSADDGTGGSVSGANSSGGSGQAGDGTGAAAAVKCGGPEDCDDGDACTTDLCNADGTCDTAPKCGGTEQCCGGECAECCDKSDCDDGVPCTANTCFSGQCMYVPEDTACDASQYCSVKDGCRARAVCGVLVDADPVAECDDDNACTADSCAGNLCQHDFCDAADPKMNLCCEGVGCAACCNDSQCDTDTDPCMVGSCKDGTCSLTPLCADGKECCPSADGKTATCGSCCSAAECDDRIGCTKDACGGGQCSHTPGACEPGSVCDPVKGCQKADMCTVNTDCHPSNGCQLNAKCEGGACHFDPCGGGTKCCRNAATGASNCARCCDASECSDNVDCTKDTCGASGCSHTPVDTNCPIMAQKCDALQGCVGCIKDTDCNDNLDCTVDTCLQNTCSHVSSCGKYQYCTLDGCSACLSDSDCQGATTTQNIILPVGCNTSTCVKGQCQTVAEDCGDFQVCCPPYGCQLNCGIMTDETQ